jgi:major type 1 subunit fimbrin (pilin)
MKTNMMKMTAAAALVLGMAGVAHADGSAGGAGNPANITITGAVSSVSCNVTVDKVSLDIGTVLASDIAALTKGDATGVYGLNDSTTVSLEGCGAPANAGNSELIFSANLAADANQSDTNAAWGDPSAPVGYGFMIHAKPTGGTGGVPKDLSHADDVLLLDTAADTSAKLETLKATIEPYMVRTTATDTDIKAGTRLTVPMVISYSHD